MSQLIALIGYAGCGKSTVAKHLVSKGWVQVKFAGPLKDMLRSIGLSEAEIEGSLKETPNELLCGQTPRHAMQTLGTQWGRDCMDEDLWANIAHGRIKQLLEAGRNVVVDDCRFFNEALVIQDLGGRIIRVIRTPHHKPMDHESESHVNELHDDYILWNAGTLEDLYTDTDDAVESLAKRGRLWEST